MTKAEAVLLTEVCILYCSIVVLVLHLFLIFVYLQLFILK